MPDQSAISLATPAGKADTPGKPDAATHVLVYWPPDLYGLREMMLRRQLDLDGLREMMRKQITRSGEWMIYTVAEYEEGDYCKGDRWRLESSRRMPAADLAAWAAGEVGYPVTLQYAGETEYGPVYWVTPDTAAPRG